MSSMNSMDNPYLGRELQEKYPAGDQPPDHDYIAWAPHSWYPRWCRRQPWPGTPVHPWQTAMDAWSRQLRERDEADREAQAEGYASALERDLAHLHQQQQGR
jgi:hypothetical protein